ncbi:MAG: four helix bundle protein [Bacteroidetes bacterium]|nr:four helix bundle protein [Bacteroidota bacterium]
MMQITELEVWKAAIELAKRCYEITSEFPDSDNYGLSAQIRRTVTNIPANVSAAASRKHGKESLRHLFRSRDLIYEVESHIYLANKLGHIDDELLESMLETLNTSKRLLFGFIKYYKRSSSSDQRYRRSSGSDNPSVEDLPPSTEHGMDIIEDDI